MTFARDRFWLWGNAARNHNQGWELPGVSRISPVEAACYMGIPNVVLWDYGLKRPMPLELMGKQCAHALRLLRERRIDGVIFLASCISDLDLDAVEWPRRWIEEVGHQQIPAAERTGHP